jgi:hypothetical protein
MMDTLIKRELTRTTGTMNWLAQAWLPSILARPRRFRRPAKKPNSELLRFLAQLARLHLDTIQYD